MFFHDLRTNLGRKIRLAGLAGAIAFLASACGAHTQSGSHLMTADAIAAPHGLISMCEDRPEFCGGDVEAEIVEAEPALIEPSTGGSGEMIDHASLMAIAEAINTEVNTALTYRTDQENWGRDEAWLLPLSDDLSTYGDCEDFALEKRQRLIAEGVDQDQLALATGWSRATGYHAMLILRTERGDFVLDNATRHVRAVNDTPYIWDRIQFGSNLLAWNRIEGYGRTIAQPIATAG